MRIGIEHEFAFKDQAGNYLDFENTEYALFKKIVDAFPYFENDDAVFDCKSLECKPKRCYIEGFERYGLEGNLTETIPKGLEIRTMPHSTIDALIDDFTNSYNLMIQLTTQHNLSPLLISYHPFKTSTTFKEPFNQIEIDLRTEKELGTALRSMLTQGFHINVSFSDLSTEKMLDLVQKITYYFPFIIPFSFSSPFYNKKSFNGLSFRNYYRTETRSLTRLLKRRGIDIIEFSGFDVCGDTQLLKSLLVLFKGILLDQTLTKRALSQDTGLLMRSSLYGFEDAMIKEQCLIILQAVKAVLKEEGEALEYLESILHTNDSYAARMKRTYQETGDIIEAISNRYDY